MSGDPSGDPPGGAPGAAAIGPSSALAAAPRVTIGGRAVGPGQPVFVIAELGVNHHGSLELARRLIDGAAWAGCDAVKLQKRTPELCVPREQWDQPRATPWGPLPQLEYRRRVELGLDDYRAIDRYCRAKGLPWFASCWDEPAVDFIERFDVPCYKLASASLTDLPLLVRTRRTGRPVMLSTGMSTLAQIDEAVTTLGQRELLLAHTTSTYPCALEQLNLRVITTLQRRYPACVVGYSGHETGLAPTWAAVALGASFVERHITLDASLSGTDQAASLDPGRLRVLVATLREIDGALGDGVKRVYPGELASAARLRRWPAGRR